MTIDLSAVSAALRAQARGLVADEAAVELLIAHRLWLARTDFTGGFLHVARGLVYGSEMAAVDWAGAVIALQAGQLACSTSEQQILRIIASLADGIPVDLRDVLTGLDETNLGLVAAAVWHAGGHRPNAWKEGEGS